MYDYTGWIVRADAGRDKDGIFCVVGVDQEQHRLLLADGKRRKIARPKAKKLGHVCELAGYLHMYDHPVIHSLKQGEPVSDRALRRALAAFKEGTSLG
ncbi:hypothetical protein D7V91_03770 [bacterium 1xD42-67]|nr:hypothetical protein D7V91_03770 [bacterium 1xD42-67]